MLMTFDSHANLFVGRALAIASLTPAAVAKVAAVDLANEHLVVQVAGKAAVVDAAFAAVKVKPE